jgi:hypothetical protein
MKVFLRAGKVGALYTKGRRPIMIERFTKLASGIKLVSGMLTVR